MPACKQYWKIFNFDLVRYWKMRLGTQEKV